MTFLSLCAPSAALLHPQPWPSALALSPRHQHNPATFICLAFRARQNTANEAIMMKVMLKQMAVVRREIKDDLQYLKGEVEGLSAAQSAAQVGDFRQTAVAAEQAPDEVHVVEAVPAPAVGRGRRVRKVKNTNRNGEESEESNATALSNVQVHGDIGNRVFTTEPWLHAGGGSQ